MTRWQGRGRHELSQPPQGANLKGPSYKVTWHDEAASAAGADDYRARRVVVTVHR
jgi:hypothetical protein